MQLVGLCQYTLGSSYFLGLILFLFMSATGRNDQRQIWKDIVGFKGSDVGNGCRLTLILVKTFWKCQHVTLVSLSGIRSHFQALERLELNFMSLVLVTSSGALFRLKAENR